MRVLLFCALCAVAAAHVAEEDADAPGPIIIRIRGPELPGPMLLPDLEDVHAAFSSAPNFLDDFGHESLFDEIFPKTHHKMQIFPGMARMDNDAGMGGLIGGIMSMMDGISRAMNRGHRVVRAHPIDLSTPPTEEHQEEEKQGHCCCKDIHTHCKSVHHDGTVAGVFAVTRCLAQREKQFHDIKPDCAEKVMETVAGACLNDIEQFCPSVQPGNSNIHTCLYTHKDNLTPTCKKYMHVTTKQLPAVHHAPKAQAVPAKVARVVLKAEKVAKPVAVVHKSSKAPRLAKEAPATALPMKPMNLASRKRAATPVAKQAMPQGIKPLYIVLGCVGAIAIAAVAILIAMRSRSQPDRAHYSSMLI